MYRPGIFRDIFSYLLPFAGILCLCIIKYRLLYSGYYQSDIYLLYQAAGDWLTDKPLYTENTYGNLMGLHTYYLLPLLALFTKPAGVYGLVLAQALLYLAAVIAWIRAVPPRQGPGISLVLTLLLCGPLGFYIFDDPVYGWHVENLLLPLTILAAAALYRERTVAAWILLLCMALLREDGALQAAGLFALYTWYRYTSGLLGRHYAFRRIALGYGLAFAFTGFSLWILSRNAEPRMHGVFAGLEAYLQHPGQSGRYTALLALYFVLLVPVLPLLFSVFYKGSRLLAATFLCMLPVLATGIAGGLYYYPDTFFSILWPSRLVYTWSLAMVCVLYLLVAGEGNRYSAYRWIWPLAGILLLQAWVLYLPAFYPTYSPWFFTRRAFTAPPPVVRQKIDRLRCMGSGLPGRQTLLVDKNFAVYFQRHDFVLCDGLTHASGKKAGIAILTAKTHFAGNAAFQPADSLVAGNVYVYFAVENHPLRRYLENCMRP